MIMSIDDSIQSHLPTDKVYVALGIFHLVLKQNFLKN